MSCSICGNKPANCDCSSEAIRLHEENLELTSKLESMTAEANKYAIQIHDAEARAELACEKRKKVEQDVHWLIALVGTVRGLIGCEVRNVSDISPEQHSKEIVERFGLMKLRLEEEKRVSEARKTIADNWERVAEEAQVEVERLKAALCKAEGICGTWRREAVDLQGKMRDVNLQISAIRALAAPQSSGLAREIVAMIDGSTNKRNGSCSSCGHNEIVHSPSIASGKGIGCTWWGCGCGKYVPKEA